MTDTTPMPPRPVRRAKHFAVVSAVLATAAIGIGTTRMAHRAEAVVGRYVADLFVFSIIRRDTALASRPAAPARSPHLQRVAAGERLP